MVVGIRLLGILIGVVSLIALYVITMLVYFACRKKWPNSKFLVEFAFIAAAFAVSIITKFVVEWSVNPGPRTIWGTASRFFFTLYSAIGSLGFEGLSHDFGSLQNNILMTLYAGTSIYVGLIMVSMISARASYEFFSYMKLLSGEKRRSIYVFTALNEESITLAESIKNECERKHKKYKIVFGGASLDPFDRKEDLCRRVMANGFLYWTYTAQEDKSIAQSLHLNNANLDSKDGLEFFVFAFESTDHIPQEENNFELVLSDLRARQKKPDGLHIDYFILTKRKVNYQAYQVVEEKMTVERKGMGVSINLWNEAQEVGRTAVRKILDNGLIETMCTDERKPISVWALGFGATGEAITTELFVQTPGAFENRSRPYAVTVFDPTDEAGEVFRAERPGYTFLDNASWHELVSRAAEESEKKAGLPAPVFAFHKMHSDENSLFNMREDILGQGGAEGPDVITISTGNDYRNVTYANAISKWIVDDRAAGGESARKVRYLVVSIFDEDNNYMLASFPKDKAIGSVTSEDGRMISVLEDDKPFLRIIIVNNLAEVYSFKDYEERCRSAFLKDSTYSALANAKSPEWVAMMTIGNALACDDGFIKAGDEMEGYLESIASEYAPIVDPYLPTDLSENGRKVLLYINALFKHHITYQEIGHGIFSLKGMWTKTSNYSVVSVEPFFHRYFTASIVALAEKYGMGPLDEARSAERAQALYAWKEHAAEMEHDRWTRLHVSDGWTLIDLNLKQKQRKQHNCILSYEGLRNSPGADTIVYDVANVLWTICENELLQG